MAWATTIGPDMRQIDYRLQANTGCGLTAEPGEQVSYRLDSDRPLEWIGEGLREVGIEPGSELDEAGKEAARLLALGRDPRTGQVLVKPKRAVDPRAKLPAAPLVEAIRTAAERAGTTPAQLLTEPRARARYERLQRALARERDTAQSRASGDKDAAPGVHRAPVGELETLANAARVRLDDVYDAGELATAREHKDARVTIGNRGYDLTLDLPKSYSVLVAMADPQLARELEDAYLDCVRETVTAMQGWAGYAMRGHHGDGQRAQRVDGTGLLGWMTVHRTARPTPGAAPDPHLHAHVTIANMVRGVDGKWSTIGAGGRDIHRHVKAAGTFMQARLRQVTGERWGIAWARDDRTAAWEITGVPPALRATFSKRQGQIDAVLTARGMDRETATTEQAKAAGQHDKREKAPAAATDLRADWHRQAVENGVDPAELVAAAMPGPGRPAPAPPPPVADVAAHVFRPEEGVTAHRKVTTYADVLAEVMDTHPGGIAGLAEAEQLTDAVLAEPVAVLLPPAGATHLSNAERYTSTDIIDAERTVLQAARRCYAAGVATLPAETVAAAVALYEAGAGHELSAEQRTVIERLACGGHGLDTVVGVAGAGKTTIMSALRIAYEAEGRTVQGAATAAVAAQNLETGAGIESRTVASWLRSIADPDGTGLAGVDVLVVDEASMVDDRHMATLAAEATRTGTKVVAIGDPLQMRAVGVGGTFAAVHEAIGGLSLSENRRQVDVDEREALAVWRTDQRRTALQRWADSGRLHVTDTPQQAHAQMVEQWTELRGNWPDVHDRIAQLLVLAHTNADVATLNQQARAAAAAAGELGPERTWRLADGDTLRLAVGDVVMTRVNDRQAGVLNGHRGVVVDVDERGRVRIERRETGPDGPRLVSAWVDAGYLERGGVQHGYAITAAKAQGLTADRTLVYGNGMDAHVLYPAMSRDRHRVDLWLALEPLETDTDRARHGHPRTPIEARQRAVAAYATRLETDLPDRLILTELGEHEHPHPRRRQLREGVDVAHRTPDQPRRGDQPATPQQARPPVRDVDALAQRVDALPDEQLRTLTRRDEIRERLHHAALTDQHRQTADEQTRREVAAELRAIAAGDTPSGRLTREQLREGLAVVRAEIHRRDRAAAAAAVPSGPVPAGAATGHVPWQQRPYGRVPTAQLPDALARAEQDATRATHAEQARLADARAGHGPAMRDLEQQREQLAAAVDAARQAEHHQQAVHAHAAEARRARAEIRAIEDAERSRGRLAKLLRPRTDQVAEQVRQLVDVARRADHAAGQARAAARPHEQLARRTPHAGEQLADLVRQWPTRAAEAIRADEHPPASAAAVAAAFTQRRPTTPEALHRRAEELRAEVALRERLDPVLARAEDAARDVEHTRQRIAHTQQQTAEPAHPQAEYDHRRRPGPNIDHGPSLGM